MSLLGNGDLNARSTTGPVPVRDLIDFHLRWHEFRPFAEKVVALPQLSATQAETVDWLIKLADRVRKEDL